VGILVEPEVNAVFANMPPAVAEAMHARGWHYYNFIGSHGYRLMCSWNTSEADVDAFIADLTASCAAG
jgi:threonine aldolase